MAHSTARSSACKDWVYCLYLHWNYLFYVLIKAVMREGDADMFEEDTDSEWHFAKTLQYLCIQTYGGEKITACFPNTLVKMLLSCLWSPRCDVPDLQWWLLPFYIILTAQSGGNSMRKLRKGSWGTSVWPSGHRSSQSVSSSWVHNPSALLATKSTICNHR